jgi:exopolysaccharide production protein ExoZ
MAPTDARSSTMQVLPGVQALRALAAGAVLLAHTGGDFEEHLSLPGLMPSFIHGGAGVDLFFVISGFVMVYSSERLFGQNGASRCFLTRRIIRIVPLYWTMTSLMLLWVIARGFAASDASPGLALASYFFIPYARPSGPIDPLYGLGWTLNYEMMFYVIFACALFARRTVAVFITSAILIAMTIVHSQQLPMPRALVFLTEPVIIEFVFGMGLALLFRSGVTMPRPACYFLVAAAVAIPLWLLWTAPPTRWQLWGIPAAMLVAAVVLADRPIVFVPPFVIALGNGSYALYLIHPAVNLLVRKTAARGLFLNPAATPWLYLAGALCLNILAALVVYYAFERPTSKFLKARLARASLSADRSSALSAPQPCEAEHSITAQKAV